MKITMLFIFTMITIQNIFPQNKDADEIKKLNQQWLDSYITKDTAIENRIFADDLILVSPNGKKMTKKEMIGNLSSQQIISVKIDSADVRMLTNNVGVITSYTTFVFKSDGKEITGKNCYQDVYIKRKERWEAVAAHVTLLNAK